MPVTVIPWPTMYGAFTQFNSRSLNWCWPKEMTLIPRLPHRIRALPTWKPSCFYVTEDNARSNWWGLRLDYFLRHSRLHLALPNHHSGKSQMPCHVDIQVAHGEAQMKPLRLWDGSQFSLSAMWVNEWRRPSFTSVKAHNGTAAPSVITHRRYTMLALQSQACQESQTQPLMLIVNYCLGALTLVWSQYYIARTGLFHSNSVLII